MTAWLLDIHNQFMLVCMGLVSLISFMLGHKLGEREGYEEGVRILAKTMILNNVKLRIENEEKL